MSKMNPDQKQLMRVFESMLSASERRKRVEFDLLAILPNVSFKGPFLLAGGRDNSRSG